ncbi:hypothetical protein SAMN05880566_112197 [Janthinobacterium sp. TND4EL3]|uniref:hypothetical protein n=1 Tax=Janthinobacterium sp. TND4EL3 TaxID=1907311 RepID=UPI0009571171|nr:hypothetical protein [Janthinobacterium sp. TND4EL3]SIR43412.1 hypothetical protein SAMN05880566_112197 [Janthinobacterium sp. TND4EL3]
MNVRPHSKAPAPSLDVQTLVELLTIGQLAMDLHQATNIARAAKDAYHKAIRDFECGEGRIDFNGPGGEEMKAETATEYAAHLAAKRASSNIKRRLQNACRKVAP